MIKNLSLTSYLIKFINKVSGMHLYSQSDIEKAVLLSLNPISISADYASAFDASYYQTLHENASEFQQNNWLIDELGAITEQNPRVVTELACGNGKFSRMIADYCSQVYAIDWARAPGIEKLPSNVTYLQKNVVTDELPTSDLVCSGDFLEHLPTNKLRSTIKKIVNSSSLGYHKIACYDDGHSHLSILPPWQWLQFFQDSDSSYRVKKIQFRRGRLDQIVIVVSNF